DCLHTAALPRDRCTTLGSDPPTAKFATTGWYERCRPQSRFPARGVATQTVGISMWCTAPPVPRSDAPKMFHRVTAPQVVRAPRAHRAWDIFRAATFRPAAPSCGIESCLVDSPGVDDASADRARCK